MKTRFSLIAGLLILVVSVAFAQKAEIKLAVDNYHRYYADGQKVKDAVKEKSIAGFREYFSKQAYRFTELSKCRLNVSECKTRLTEEGQFSDLNQTERQIFDQHLLSAPSYSTDNVVANFLTEAFNRLWKIAESYRGTPADTRSSGFRSLLKGIIHYGTIEAGRSNKLPRFHASCFAIPTASVNIYFALLPEMATVEAGKSQNDELNSACDILKMLGLQAWTQPLRNDSTDNNVVQIDRFQNHVWWVGGNALAYRSLLPVAFMYKSIPMVDVVAEVSQRCISTTSQTTNHSSFWTEGFTADGAGWGHGRQSLVWGYPIDGTSNALSLLNFLRKSPWEKPLSKENTEALMNFFRGSNWYYSNGHELPGLNRETMRFDTTQQTIRYDKMLKTLLTDWKKYFSRDEQAELQQLLNETQTYTIRMKSYPAGFYNGTRWFFNNDDLIKKNDRYHIMVNMASVRCDGLESAVDFADEYNFFTDDGMTLFEKSGNEYRSVFGGWDVTASPGVTAREGMDKLTPVTNWRGYCSKFNFAGAATAGGDNAVAGFIFEKMNASKKNNVNDRGTSANENPVLYGVKAHKAWFMLGDYFVALGAGVTNLHPEMEGKIRTTIDQTASNEPLKLFQDGKTLKMKTGVQSFTENGKPLWVIQKNQFAYTILPEWTQNAFFVNETKQDDWIKLNKQNKSIAGLPESVNILRLWVDHGQTVKDGTYGYVVYTGENQPDKLLPFSVLRNDTLVQAIQSTDGKVTEAVFYSANASLRAGKEIIKVSAPCVLLMDKSGKNAVLSVEDPQMNTRLKQIRISAGTNTYSVDLPQGALAGKPAVVQLKD